MAVRRDDGQWRYRKVVKLPNGSRVRISGTPSFNTKQAAETAERAHIERALDPRAQREVTRLDKFADEFMRTYVEANNKPSERQGKRYILDAHIRPMLGSKSLDEIGPRDVEALKAKLVAKGRSPKTVNNVLTVLGRLLRYAEESGLLATVPRIKLVKVPPQRFDFLEPEEFGALVEAARSDAELLVAVLLGGDAGLRQGEILALSWADVDLRAKALTVQRSDWYGTLVAPKSGRPRTVPLTTRLEATLRELRHLRGPRVLCGSGGEPWTRETMRWHLPRLATRAGLRRIGWHTLRHTFCSHLALRNAPAKAIQELAGHSSLTTTLRYMHLQPSALRDAVRLLEGPAAWQQRGNVEDPKTKKPTEFRRLPL